MKRKNIYIIFSIALVFIVTFVAFYSAYTYSASNVDYIDNLLSGESYSYLPLGAKNYIKYVYETTGDVLLTEKNKVNGLSYLNPEYVDYLGLTNTERNALEVIPDEMVYDFVYNESSGTGSTTLPANYDLRNVNGKSYSTSVKNQGSLGLCWDFSGVASIESNLLKSGLVSTNNPILFNERAIDYVRAKDVDIPYNSEQEQQIYSNGPNPLFPDGFGHIGSGNHVTKAYQYAMYGYGLQPMTTGTQWSSYFTNHPTLNIEDIFNLKQYAVTDYKKYSKLVYSVEEDSDTQQSFDNVLKQHIITNGVLSVATVSPSDNACVVRYTKNGVNYRVINRNSACVNHAIDNRPKYTHAMAIVGWDDNFEQYYCTSTTDDNVMSNTITNNATCNDGDVLHHVKGVWIVKNSWGTEHGNQGYAYLAYQSREDSFYGVTKTIERDFNNFYSSSSPFENATINNDSNNNYIVNFEKNNHYEKLKRITIELKNMPSNHTIEVFINDKSNHYVSLGTINIDYLGIYSIDVNDYSLDTRNFTIKVENAGLNLNSVIENVIAYTEDTNQTLRPVESVTINGCPTSMVPLGTSSINLTATVLPTNATNQTVTWSSNHPTIATVENGVVTFQTDTEGTVTITASAEGKSDSCRIEVGTPLQSVDIDSRYGTTVSVDDNLILFPQFNPTSATNIKNITWSSKNENRATVSIGPGYRGIVHGVHAGIVTITLTVTTTNNQTFTKDISINVIPRTISSTRITLNTDSMTLYENGTPNIGQLTYTLTPEGTTDTVTWASSNSNVATVSNGLVTAKSAGTTTITATTSSGNTATCTVTVNSLIQSTTYRVEHYKENVDGGYPSTPTEIENGTGTVGSVINPQPKTYTGFNTPSRKTYTLQNGSNIIRYEYSRKTFTVTLDKDNGIASVSGGGEYKYGKFVTISATVKSGYTWKEWVSGSKHYQNSIYSFTMGASNVIYKATTTVNSTPEVTIDVSPSSLTLEQGKIQTIKAEVSPKGNYTVKWESENKNVAIVDQNGNVTAKGIGETKIIASIDTADGQKQATCRVTVVKQSEILPTGITLNKNETTILVNNEETLTATVLPVSATNKDVTWTSSDNTIATVVNGKITCLKEGEVIIAAKTKNNKTAECKVHIKNGAVHVTGVSINESNIQLGIGETKQLTSNIIPSGATNQNVTWSSSKEDVATINNSGLVTAKKAGKTTITVTTVDGNKTATVIVEVKNDIVSVSKIEVSPLEVELEIGQTQQLTTKVTPDNATNKSVTYSSSDKSVAEVNASGLVTAKSSGEAIITVTSNSGNQKATMKVKVHAGISIQLDKIKVSILKGHEYKLNATVTGTSENITWTSSDNSIATVNNGVIKAINKGTVTITAQLNNANMTANCEVTVVTEDEQKIEFASSEYNIFLGDYLEPDIITTPTDMKIDKIEWIIENEDVISLEDNKLKSLKIGSTKVTIKVNSKYEAETIVNVNEKPLIVTIEGYSLGFDASKYSYELKINKEKELKITANKEIEIEGNKDLKNKSIIKIIDLSNQKEYEIKIIKKNNLIIYFIAIIGVLILINLIRIIKKRRD